MADSTTNNLFLSIKEDSRPNRVVAMLMDLITSGKLLPGDFLPSEPELSKSLGVSRSTARQALRTLEARGLVITKHGVGVQVTNRTREVATDSIGLMLLQSGGGPQDLLEVRLMLECQGAALAAIRATDDDIRVLALLVDSMHQHSSDLENYVDSDLKFHLHLAESSKNAVLVALVHAIRGLLLNSIMATYSVNGSAQQRLEQHARILDAIIARDPVAADTAMRAHLRRTEEVLHQIGLLSPSDRREQSESPY